MFETAIKELLDSGDLIGIPESFQAYKARVGITIKSLSPAGSTAKHISIYSVKGLRPELQEAQCTVFRLGSRNNNRFTHFALAKVNKDWSDYFLMDEILFTEEPEFYDISKIPDINFLFNLLPSFSESALVSLSLASGILFKALNLKKQENLIIPAQSSGSYTFNFKPLSVSDKILNHVKGQVEIDSFFLAERDNKKCLFIVEAKMNKSGRGVEGASLAKHKLLYPILSIQEHVKDDVTVIPVYIRYIINNSKKSLNYGKITINISECSLPRVNGIFGSIDKLVPVKNTRYIFNSKNAM